MRRNRKSFVKTCILYLSIYSCILFSTFILGNRIIESNIKNITFDFGELAEYDKELKNDDFSKIPLKDYPSKEMVVYDENDHIIYETHNYKISYIPLKYFHLLDDFSYESYFYVEPMMVNNEKQYIISKYVATKEEDVIVDYAIVDSNFRVVSGNLFKDKEQFTKKEFQLLKDGTVGKNYISKYMYTNIEGKKRTILFYEREMSTEEYISLIGSATSDWLFIIPVVLLETVVIIFLFYIKIKKSIHTLNKNIIDVEGKEDDIPIEFLDFYYKMSELLNHLEEEKQKRQDEEMKRQSIITDLSHDLKTPLTVIQGYAKAFKDGIVPVEQQEKYMNAIYDKSILATEIINSLFQYAQMEHVEFKPTYIPTDFSEFCREYLALKYTELEMQGYQLSFELVQEKEILEFDTVLMTRLFDNIINNCVKHNQMGTTIYFQYTLDKDNIYLTIGDNGKGLEIKDTRLLFEPFVVGNEARTSGVGTGLGLYISKRIVDLHHGKIKIVENPESPYKFKIDIILKRMK